MPLDYRDAIPKLLKEPVDTPNPDAEWLLWVSDGAPEPGKALPIGEYDSSVKKYRLAPQASPADNMYSVPRMATIRGTVGYASEESTQCYVMTTGYGPVDALKHRRAYNVPGEIAIEHEIYRDFYQNRIRALLEKMKSPRLIVFYAPVTKEPFRDEIFNIICSIPQTRVVMYGVSKHKKIWAEYPYKMIKCLESQNEDGLNDLREKWFSDNQNVYPFFRFCIGD